MKHKKITINIHIIFLFILYIIINIIELEYVTDMKLKLFTYLSPDKYYSTYYIIIIENPGFTKDLNIWNNMYTSRYSLLVFI